MDARFSLIILVVLVATAIFVVLLRTNRARDQKGREEAEARGETVAPRKVSPTLLYFVLGVVFVIVGLFEVLKR